MCINQTVGTRRCQSSIERLFRSLTLVQTSVQPRLTSFGAYSGLMRVRDGRLMRKLAQKKCGSLGHPYNQESCDTQ